MAQIDEQARSFLAGRRIAVAGVSIKREDAANHIYRKLKKDGYQVFAVNPGVEAFDGDPCFPDLKSLPEKVDGVIIVTGPKVSLELIQQCIESGIDRVWMHCSLGTRPLMKKTAQSITSVSDEAVRLGKEHGIEVIPGGCPMMFADPVDFGHRCMRGFLRVMGGFRSSN